MVACLLLLAAVSAVPELQVDLTVAPMRITVQLAVHEAPPDDWQQALAAGAPVSITYPLQLYRNRRWLWDQRLSEHELVVRAQRDPLTGTFTLVSELDGEILASGQASSVDEAVHWMANPPTVEIPVPPRHEPLWLVVRAEFLRRYVMLVIPSTVGTDWVQRAIPETP